MPEKSPSTPEEAMRNKRFNARLWFTWALTIFLGVISVPIADYFSLGSKNIFPAAAIAGFGIWSFLLWDYLPHPIRFFKYVWNSSSPANFRYRTTPPIEDDTDEIIRQKVYFSTSPLVNIIIALCIFCISYLVYKS